MKSINYQRVFKYIFFGGISTVSEILVFVILSKYLTVYWSALISFSFALILSFALNKKLVFKSKGNSRSVLGRFILLGIFNSQVSPVITVLLSSQINDLIAKLITMLVVALWSYVLMNKLIFRTAQ